ncbi:hypothetical protein [Shouchella lonarensis]|uniref:Uncharacterized protein n=1 Tax=Shouchella lonarensis TaxID=1464122 RepID=A0A1G6HNJ4_9BACI|nr:hypothetical protein [Shouchella lonarensis]SDB95455.1 hypothetical protein SAMN05421737_10479 [Shouchella lonarensis]
MFVEKLYWTHHECEGSAHTKTEKIQLLGCYWDDRIFTLDDESEHIEHTRVGYNDPLIKRKEVCRMINKHTSFNITNDTKHFVYETSPYEESCILTVFQDIFGAPQYEHLHFDSLDKMVDFSHEA